MRDSCRHLECLRVLNIAAWLATSEGVGSSDDGVLFVDLALVEPGLRPFSLDCSVHDAVVYAKHEEDEDWFMARVSQVTDPDLIRRLEEAAAAGQPMQIAPLPPLPPLPPHPLRGGVEE